MHDGLTVFDPDVVRERNRPGVMVDVSHVADSTFYDPIEVSKAPATPFNQRPLKATAFLDFRPRHRTTTTKNTQLVVARTLECVGGRRAQ